MSNKTFLRTVRPFLTNKGILMDSETSLIHNGKTIHDEKQIAKTINHTYNNVLEHTAETSLPVFLMIQSERGERLSHQLIKVGMISAFKLIIDKLAY